MTTLDVQKLDFRSNSLLVWMIIRMLAAAVLVGGIVWIDRLHTRKWQAWLEARDGFLSGGDLKTAAPAPARTARVSER